jgi:pyruvate,orthophosphate dikinase
MVSDAAPPSSTSVLGPHGRVLASALADDLDRLGGYPDRLAHAHDRVVAGDHAWLTRPTVDSYHTVWFELHEDLLATLGRSRSDERGDGAERRAGDNAEEFA